MFKLFRCTFILFSAVVVLTIACYLWVNWRARNHLFDEVNHLPHKRVALVLGTSKYLAKGVKNEYYQNRIAAAAKLYHAGKVDYFVVSGDNREHNYNEPKQMQKDLIEVGVPADRIQPDYAGFRTLDSVLRMDKVFGHQDYVIISQRFHNQRAIFLAHAHGQHPIAFNADNPQKQSMKKVLLREMLARVKAVLDIITDKQAKFYGDKIIFPPNTA